MKTTTKKRKPAKKPKATAKKKAPTVEYVAPDYCLCGSGYFRSECPCVLNDQYW